MHGYVDIKLNCFRVLRKVIYEVSTLYAMASSDIKHIFKILLLTTRQ